jgi:hypothetical protein
MENLDRCLEKMAAKIKNRGETGWKIHGNVSKAIVFFLSPDLP